MAVSCGFYNSLDGDRKYDAREFGQLFDGIIRDGIFMSIGTSMMVTADEGMTVIVGIGHAWFNQSWTTNDAPMAIEVPQSEVLLDRIDTIVLEVDTRIDVRDNDIKLIKGMPSSEPVRPELINEDGLYQYPLCDIYVKAEIEEITQADITNRVGMEETPFVTGILETISIDSLVAQWQDEWYRYIRAALKETSDWTEQQKQILENYEKEFENDINTWKYSVNVSFNEWFENLKYVLDGDVAGHLQLQLDELNQREFEQRYALTNKTTRINKNSENITESIIESYDDAVATTVFSENKQGKTITMTMVPNEGVWNYVKTVEICKVDGGTEIRETYSRTIKQ